MNAGNLIQIITKAQALRARGGNKKLWERGAFGVGGYNPIYTLYNYEGNVVCFDHGFSSQRGKERPRTCRVLSPGDAIENTHIFFYGNAFGKVIIRVGYSKFYSFDENHRFQFYWMISDESEDRSDCGLERGKLDSDFLISIFGKVRIKQFRSLKRDISRDILKLLTVTHKD